MLTPDPGGSTRVGYIHGRRRRTKGGRPGRGLPVRGSLRGSRGGVDDRGPGIGENRPAGGVSRSLSGSPVRRPAGSRGSLGVGSSTGVRGPAAPRAQKSEDVLPPGTTTGC
ncbi:hypothetical protein M1M38_gp114 [Halorubrum tailed virus 27]|uniref:Uncharacterized protein n=1 Tax=Halorubrum tailed virus 27 TaxID=2878008 RepID=A0AAE8XZ10_9CAUD|nr:hypothetical protein M1M38_gp001 [Halorubrum tailed virus 27]YP_010358303.1 hypothetical protein M1M38_gp114 [Halorubrum tailed virus 27]UBF22694.1 hypothetical protein HRTV-27_gp1 [Halorubrum tailed virus 27]UBF22807.1 hypothetical protein [Halorubrum tailed virus 27]